MDVRRRNRKLDDKIAGNEESVACLTKWLAHAKAGKICHVAIVLAEDPDKIWTESIGSIGPQLAVSYGLGRLQRDVERMVAERVMPWDHNVPNNQVAFSAGAAIVSYDFLCWLIGAEMWRVRKNAKAPLKVCFFRAPQPDIRLPDYQVQMYNNVALPLVGAIGGEVNQVPNGRGDFSNTYNEIVEAHHRGESVPRLKASPGARMLVEALLDEVKPITITLREAGHWPHRNSDLTAWSKVAHDLEAKGEQVIIVRDTAKADEPFDEFETFPRASVDLNVRMALYEHAKANLFVANGPAVLNFHLDTPCLMFSEIDHKHHCTYEPAWPEWWPKHQGIEAGEQFPWMTSAQRIVWQRDTYSNISAALEALAL